MFFPHRFRDWQSEFAHSYNGKDAGSVVTKEMYSWLVIGTLMISWLKAFWGLPMGLAKVFAPNRRLANQLKDWFIDLSKELVFPGFDAKNHSRAFFLPIDKENVTRIVRNSHSYFLITSLASCQSRRFAFPSALSTQSPLAWTKWGALGHGMRGLPFSYPSFVKCLIHNS